MEVEYWAPLVGNAGFRFGGLFVSIVGLNVTLRFEGVGIRIGDFEVRWESARRGLDSEFAGAAIVNRAICRESLLPDLVST